MRGSRQFIGGRRELLLDRIHSQLKSLLKHRHPHDLRSVVHLKPLNDESHNRHSQPMQPLGLLDYRMAIVALATLSKAGRRPTTSDYFTGVGTQ